MGSKGKAKFLFYWDWEEYARIVEQIERKGLEYSLRQFEMEPVKPLARGKRSTK